MQNGFLLFTFLNQIKENKCIITDEKKKKNDSNGALLNSKYII